MFAHIRILVGCLGVLGVITLIALPAYSQKGPFNRDNTNPSRTRLNEPIIRINPGNLNGTGSSHPYGSRINDGGAITTPRGQVIYPNVGVKNGDGSTTYYYQNGTSITVDQTKVPATGGILR